MVSTVVATALRQGPPLLARGRTDLVPALFMRRDEPLLAAVLAEEAGRLDATLEAAVQLLERLALASSHEHTGLLHCPRCIAPVAVIVAPRRGTAASTIGQRSTGRSGPPGRPRWPW